MHRKSYATLGIASALFALTLALAVSPASAQKVTERYRMNAMGTGHYGLAAGRATRLELVVYRWVTPDERVEIIKTLETDDGKKVVRYLEQRETVGRLMIPGQPGVDVRYLWNVEQDGKNYVVAASERSLASQPGATTGSAPYYIAVIQLELDDSGKGTGTFAPGLHPKFNANGTVNITSTIADPIQLTGVVHEPAKKKGKK